METRYGFIHEKIDIKILILFILRRLVEPIDFNNLSELTIQCDGGIGYFDFTDCISELVETGHVINGDLGYRITDKGIKINKITEDGLPYTVKTKAEKLAMRACEAQRRNSMIHTSHSAKTRGGNMVKLSMSDGVSDIIKLEILSASEQQSVRMEENFRKNAEAIYLHLVKMLSEGEN